MCLIKMRKILIKLLKICASIIIMISVIIIGIKHISNWRVSSKVSFIINKIAMARGETEEYKNEFIQTTYKNYKIVHNKEFTSALSMIFAYLDKLGLRINELFGYTPIDELIIQIDYDEDVFKSRSLLKEAVGYYNDVIKTIYMLAEEPYNNVIMDRYDIEYLQDGNVLMSTSTFRDILFHEYSHYAVNSFINKNNISAEVIPIWFKEGISEYIACANKANGRKLEYISLNKLNTIKEWRDSLNNENNNVYIQSMYAIYSMVNLSDENKLKDIIINCKEMSFHESFKKVMGISLGKFDNYLRDEFKSYEELYKPSNSSTLDYNEAKIKCLEEYIKANEDDIKAYETLSTFYEYNRGFDITLEFLKESIKKHPEEPSLWRYLAILYENNNMLDLANECYLKEKELNLK